MAAPLPDTAYWQAFDDNFSGVLTWDAFDVLWSQLNTSTQDWYVFDLGENVPTLPSTTTAFQTYLSDIQTMYAPVRNRSYCGAVYVDDAKKPRMLKVFDPYKMGSACGCSGERILPRFILSQMKPDTLPIPEPVKKPGLFARLTTRA